MPCRSCSSHHPPVCPWPEPPSLYLRLTLPQEREELKKQGFVKAAAQSVMEKAADGKGSWVTLSRPGA